MPPPRSSWGERGCLTGTGEAIEVSRTGERLLDGTAELDGLAEPDYADLLRRTRPKKLLRGFFVDQSSKRL